MDVGETSSALLLPPNGNPGPRTECYVSPSFRSDAVGEDLLDTGAPFYDVYRTKDGQHLAVCVRWVVLLCTPVSAILLRGGIQAVHE